MGLYSVSLVWSAVRLIALVGALMLGYKTASFRVLGEDLLLQPLQSNGQLKWAPLGGDFQYSVEWAPTADGPWLSGWANLQDLKADGTNAIVVAVPMFFRVRAITNAVPKNMVALAGSGHRNLLDGTAIGTIDGTHDASDSTYYGAYRFHNADGNAQSEITSTHTWDAPVNLIRIRTKVLSTPIALGGFPKHQSRFEIVLREGTEWKSVYVDDTGEVAGSGVETVRDIQLERIWTNITGIRVLVRSQAYSFSGNRRQEVTASIFEVEAWGL
jgi:hypothetical protein